MEEQIRQEAYHSSRLGQILMKKGYISPEQLDEAIHLSEGNDQHLGEYLIKHRMISWWQLRRALSSQSQLRLSAFLSMVLLSPVYKLLSGEKIETEHNMLVTLFKPLLVGGSATAFEYDPNLSMVEIKHNGLIRLRIPSSLGELNFDGIRLKTNDTKNYQDLTLEDLELANARLFIRTIHNKLDQALS